MLYDKDRSKKMSLIQLVTKFRTFVAQNTCYRRPKQSLQDHVVSKISMVEKQYFKNNFNIILPPNPVRTKFWLPFRFHYYNITLVPENVVQAACSANLILAALFTPVTWYEEYSSWNITSCTPLSYDAIYPSVV
jgi:hypothetical protein